MRWCKRCGSRALTQIDLDRKDGLCEVCRTSQDVRVAKVVWYGDREKPVTAPKEET